MSNLPTVEELRKMEIVGYWDSEFYRGVSSGSGVILRAHDGRKIKLSYAQIAKIRKQSEAKCRLKKDF